MQAYCMKCRAKKEIREPKRMVMKNGRPATQGVCPVCGSKLFRIGVGRRPIPPGPEFRIRKRGESEEH